MKKLALLTAVLIGVSSLPNTVFAQSSVTPPPPPPPPPVKSETQTLTKAERLLKYVQTVVTDHEAFQKAEVALLNAPNNAAAKQAADEALKTLASSLDDLMRNAKSLENDIKKLVKKDIPGEESSFAGEKSAIQKQKLPPKRKQSEINLIEELKAKFKARVDDDN